MKDTGRGGRYCNNENVLSGNDFAAIQVLTSLAEKEVLKTL